MDWNERIVATEALFQGYIETQELEVDWLDLLIWETTMFG